MLLIPRLILGLAFLHILQLAHQNAAAAPMTGDLANAGYLALAVLLALANAAVWAPALGNRLAAPLTNMLTEGASYPAENLVLRWLRHCRKRGARKWALALALLEGVRHPDRPTAFLLGLRCALPGSCWERVFAAELWRFDNLRNCLLAFRVLQRHGLDPRPHPNQEVNLALRALEPAPRGESQPLRLARHEPAPEPPRNRRIRLFQAADQVISGPEQGGVHETGPPESREASPAAPAREAPEAPGATAAAEPERGAP